MPLFTRPRSDTPTGARRRHSRTFAVGAAAALALTAVVAAPALASHGLVSLPGSDFEIDTDANLKVDHDPPSIDWASVTENRKADEPTGSTDDSFGQGSKEDTAVPAVVDGSIPPNKSDLLNFGTYLESTASGDFLHLFWHRVQEPSGTTNMDFEFNQSDVISSNGVTPVRTAGDLLIQYDLSQGGTNPQLFLSEWVATGDKSLCEAANSTPCWSDRISLSASGDATGSINTTAIPAAESDGLAEAPGEVSPRTFGEASVDFSAIVGDDECVSFGSAYLKSRSSDSFTSALKDFIAPAPTDLDNCAKVIIRKVTDPAEDPAVTMFGYTTAFETETEVNPTFSLGNGGVQEYDNVFLGTGLSVSEDTPPAGWDFDSVDCSASTGVTPSIVDATVTFDLDDNSDVLDCTYTNKARGSIVVEKITDDGFGSFEFTSSTLSPSPFTLTTTAAGDAGKDSETFSDLPPGTYDVDETVPPFWNLVSATCDDGSDPSAIGLSAGETVTCTFHDAREVGAILISKIAKHAAATGGEMPHAGVTFTVTGGELPAGGVTAVTDANGLACVPGLVVSDLVGTYTVTETVPTGYHVVGSASQTAFVSESEGDCDPITPGASVAFENLPLTNLTVSVDSQIDGGTSSTIECVPGLPDPDFTTPASGDGSLTLNDLEPQTVVCTIVIDP